MTKKQLRHEGCKICNGDFSDFKPSIQMLVSKNEQDSIIRERENSERREIIGTAFSVKELFIGLMLRK